jgi:hypothetical protein
MRFADLKNRHPGAVAVVLGTGGTLDGFEAEYVPGNSVVIAINRAALVAPRLPSPGRTYWIVMDNWQTVGVPKPEVWDAWLAECLAGKMSALLASPLYGPKPRLNQEPFESEFVARWIPRGDRGGLRNPNAFLNQSREFVAESGCLYTFAGSAPTAIHAAWLMGCSAVKLFGCDGDHSVAECLKPLYAPERPVNAPHDFARRIAEETGAQLGIKLEFAHA